MICPHKEALECEATARLIIDGHCSLCCPYTVTAYNNVYDPFGRSVGYHIERLRPREASP